MSKKQKAFFDRVQDLNKKHRASLCVGIDPHTTNLPPYFQKQAKKNPATFLLKFSQSVIDAAKKKAGVVKFQSAYFEAHGPKGVAALAQAIKYAKRRGLLTILDVKRGDITDTMSGYVRMAFEAFDADAITVLPYMGIETLKPLLPWFEKGKGVYVVWVSSNPEATALQNLVSDFVLDSCCDWINANHAEGSLGLVCGATKLQMLNDHQKGKAKKFGLLVPGVGAQGAKIDHRLFEIMTNSPGSVFSVSRSLTGFGLQEEYGTLKEIKSWTSYTKYVQQKITLLL